MSKDFASALALQPDDKIVVAGRAVDDFAVARYGGPDSFGDELDCNAPETTITKGPKKVVKIVAKRTKVRFRFIADEATSAFECKLVKGRRPARNFKACASPARYRLKPAKYMFAVRAVDVAGNTDPSPTTFRFRVKAG